MGYKFGGPIITGFLRALLRGHRKPVFFLKGSWKPQREGKIKKGTDPTTKKMCQGIHGKYESRGRGRFSHILGGNKKEKTFFLRGRTPGFLWPSKNHSPASHFYQSNRLGPAGKFPRPPALFGAGGGGGFPPPKGQTRAPAAPKPSSGGLGRPRGYLFCGVGGDGGACGPKIFFPG